MRSQAGSRRCTVPDTSTSTEAIAKNRTNFELLSKDKEIIISSASGWRRGRSWFPIDGVWDGQR